MGKEFAESEVAGLGPAEDGNDVASAGSAAEDFFSVGALCDMVVGTTVETPVLASLLKSLATADGEPPGLTAIDANGGT